MNEKLELLKEKIQQTNQEMVDLVSNASSEDDIFSIRNKFDILDLKLRGFQREFNVLKTFRDISLFEKFEKEESLLEEDLTE